MNNSLSQTEWYGTVSKIKMSVSSRLAGLSFVNLFSNGAFLLAIVVPVPGNSDGDFVAIIAERTFVGGAENRLA